MEAFVDCELPQKPPNTHIDMGPLIGHQRGFRTREKVPFSGGLAGVEMVALEPMSRATSSSSTDSEPHGRLLDGDIKPQSAATPTSKPCPVSSTSRKRRHDGSIRDGRGASSSDSEVDQTGALYRSIRFDLVPTPAVATPRQRQKRRIDPKVPDPDLARTVDQRTVPAKMRKRWIHQTMQEATPRPTGVDETSGTEEEHMDIDHGNSTLLSAFCPSAHLVPDSAIMPPPPVPPRRKSKKSRKPPASPSPAPISSPSTPFAKLSLLSPTVEISKSSLDVALSSFDNRPQSPTPSTSSPTLTAPSIRLHTTPISPLLTFTSLPPQPMVVEPPPAQDSPAVQQPRVDSPIDEKPARSVSPNLLGSLPGLRRGQKEEPVPIDTQEFPAPLPIITESALPPADGGPATSQTHTPPSVPSEIPPINDLPPDPDPSPLDEPPLQQLSEPCETTSTFELLSSPTATQSELQLTPQDALVVEPTVEVKQESERQLTPPPIREASPVPQKVKTSFKDFLMRKKKEQVESPIIPTFAIPPLEPSPTVLATPAPESDAIATPSEAAKQPVAVPLERPSGPPPTEPPDTDMDTSSSPAPEPEPVKVESSATQPPQSKPDDPPESWLLESQFLKPDVAVCLRQGSVHEWDPGEFVGTRGYIESLVNLPGRPPSASFRPFVVRSRVVIPVTAILPARPSRGESAIILSGQHEGKVGKVVKITEDIVSIDLNGPETTVIDVEPRLVCLLWAEKRTPLYPLLPPALPLSEKGNSMSPPPLPQSEDGEIPQDPLPRSQSHQQGNPPSPPVTTPLRVAPLNAPTQPRSFQSAWKNNTLPTVPSRPNSISHLLNANPNGGVSSSLNNLGTAFANSPNRPGPPSGPKALRGLNPRTPFDVSRYKTGMGPGLGGNGMSGPTGVNGNGLGAGLKRELNPNNGHPAIPKGPSADRDRERERGSGNWSTKNWGSGWR